MATKQNMLYVGGIDDEVTEDLLFAAFIPFGPLKSVQIPKDFKINKSRGFGFVEFESDEDCAAALENMEGAELFGKVLRCNIAKAMGKGPAGKAIWSADEWIKNHINEIGDESNPPVEDEE